MSSKRNRSRKRKNPIKNAKLPKTTNMVRQGVAAYFKQKQLKMSCTWEEIEAVQLKKHRIK